MPEPKDTTKSSATSEENEELPEEWMLRPCDMYKEEYDDCTSIKARFNQYFIYGETIDCSQWKTDYHNCYLWQKYKSKKAYDELVSSERQRRTQRLLGHYKNNVWEKRDKPPENWNAPLPKWMEEKNENTYLKHMSDKMKNDKPENISSSSKSCTIL